MIYSENICVQLWRTGIITLIISEAYHLHYKVHYHALTSVLWLKYATIMILLVRLLDTRRHSQLCYVHGQSTVQCTCKKVNKKIRNPPVSAL